MRVGWRPCLCPTAGGRGHETWTCAACGLVQVWRGCTGDHVRNRPEQPVFWPDHPPDDAEPDAAREQWGRWRQPPADGDDATAGVHV